MSTDVMQAEPVNEDSVWLQLINDPRDIVHLRLMGECGLFMLAGLALFAVGSFPWWVACVYWAVWGFGFVDRYTLMLHCTSHRPLFKRQYKMWNRLIPWYFGPFFGQSPGTYYHHHMRMHHREGNLHGDLSSTMRFQRDSIVDWLRYFGRFFFFALFELGLYFHNKGKDKVAMSAVAGELSFFLLCALAWQVSPQASFVVFIGPWLMTRFMMMAGNWGQHAFVDADEPDNDFKASITCINTRYNRRCYNDGYHIVHHRKPAMHYTDMAREFAEHRELYGKEDAIVFDGVDFFQVWLYLMLHRHEALAKRFVQLPGAPERNQDEIVAFLKSRLAPILA